MAIIGVHGPIFGVCVYIEWMIKTSRRSGGGGCLGGRLRFSAKVAKSVGDHQHL